MIENTPWIAILIAAVVSFAFGAFWYSVFSKPWMEASGQTIEEVQSGPGAPIMVLTFGCQLVMAFVLSGIMYHSGGYSVQIGLISAILVWVGFVITTQTVNNVFQGKPRKLTLIDGGHWLGALILQSLVIGVMGG